MGEGLVLGSSWYCYQQDSVSLSFSWKQKIIPVGMSQNLGAIFSKKYAILVDFSINS